MVVGVTEEEPVDVEEMAAEVMDVGVIEVGTTDVAMVAVVITAEVIDVAETLEEIVVVEIDDKTVEDDQIVVIDGVIVQIVVEIINELSVIEACKGVETEIAVD